MPKITYTEEFKRDAVALVASGIPQKQVDVLGGGTVPRHDSLREHVTDERGVDETCPRPDVDIPREPGVKQRRSLALVR